MNWVKKNNVLALLLLTLMALLVGCQSRRPAITSVACDQTYKLKSPRVIFTSTEYDFGRVEMGSQNTCSFKFCNGGGEDLVIENIFASCGCTVTKAEKSTIPPGGTSEITVTYRADNFGKSR
jgi:hypothetical protein